MLKIDKIILFVAIVSALLLIGMVLSTLIETPYTKLENTTHVNGTFEPGIVKPTDNPAEYYQLTEEQKKAAEAIALNDTFVKSSIASAESRTGSGNYFGPFYSFTPGSYRVGNITIDRVNEVSPGFDRIRYLPGVEVIIGNESEGDLNIYAYVDLDEERVAYIGFTNRSGPNPGHYMFLSRPDGVTEYTDILRGEEISNFYMIGSFINYTILNTGYQPELTDEDKAKLIGIAESDRTVKSFVKNATDREARVNSAPGTYVKIDTINGHQYAGTYPTVSILPVEKDGSEGESVLLVEIFQDNVTSVNEYPNYGRLWHQLDRH